MGVSIPWGFYLTLVVVGNLIENSVQFFDTSLCRGQDRVVNVK